MPTGIPGSSGGDKAGTPATKAQKQRYGHVAAVLGQLLKERKWSPRAFNQAIGKKVTNTGIYIWLNAKGGPGPAVAAAISQRFNIPLSDLTPTGGFSKFGGGAHKPKTANGMTWVEPKTITGVVMAPTAPLRSAAARSLLSFVVEPDGLHARLTIDVTLPVADGFSLLNIIKEASALSVPRGEP